MDDPLRKIAEDIVNARNGISQEVRDKMIEDLVIAMERHINAEFIARLNDDQIKEFNDFLGTNPSDEQTVEFVKGKGIDVNDAVTTALRTFKNSYLGD